MKALEFPSICDFSKMLAIYGDPLQKTTGSLVVNEVVSTITVSRVGADINELVIRNEVEEKFPEENASIGEHASPSTIKSPLPILPTNTGNLTLPDRAPNVTLPVFKTQ